MLTYRNAKSAYVCGLIFCLGVFQTLWTQAITAQPVEVRSVSDTQLPNVIRVSTNLVTVPVSVTDTAGHAVSNLNIGDFTLKEDGNAEVISRLAEAGQSPIQFALLFDLSGSVNPRFEFALQAANRFLEKTWKPGDRISIISFSEQPGVCLDASGFLPEALQSLQKLEPTKGPTAFFDSVMLSARMLRQSATPETRKTAIALSDGEDNESLNGLHDAAREVQRSDVIFYSINPSGASIRLNAISLKGQQNLESLAAETGGTAFVSDKEADLDAIFDRIAAELRAQYLLSYYSSNPRLDGQFRRITVLIPRNPDLRVRARQGYYAVRK
jgi:Ca-activated chloride channel family protein